MSDISLLFIGFGVVGRGLAELILEKMEVLRSSYNIEVKVLGICDLRWGSIVNDDGLDLARALKLVDSGKTLDHYDLPARRGLSSLEAIREVPSDIVIEVTWTNLETGEPGLTHIKEALILGRHVATTNKGPIALAYRELMDIAKAKNVKLKFEGTVLSGTPTFNFRWSCLKALEVRRIRGILNGTTNFILTEMERGVSYSEALRKAQELGYAEADPTLDVDGWDAAAKAVILANVLMDGDLKLRSVERRGIRGISMKEILEAVKNGYKVKLLAEIWKEDDEVKAKVSPTRIPVTDALSSVSGVLNAIQFETDVLEEVTIVGAGAGRRPTGYALLSDILEIASSCQRT
ncbi:MAG: homoserine dehydrogenase [Candidatus Nezhaarchaeota archaeon]|nr:homoserine dehydrogenase [Candidatus Nezhaarchaeota archaeon]MCX8142463.1 homoserine dehydrogenase [Candidatus Nezhaarchaeota archaeon]MDW8050564.1 homoserine dehydrogenase [Nitrososphaerota archaeon]